MPIHDWSRVGPGIFHDFHQSWITEIKRVLNSGTLPPNFYALAEQFAGDIGPDVLALERTDRAENWQSDLPDTGCALAVAAHPPKVSVTAKTELVYSTQKQQTLVIRHSSGDRIVALIEIVSAGNKSSQSALNKLLDKTSAAIQQGYHLLILDLQPPTPRDPQGIHGAIWSMLSDDRFRAPPGKPLTLAAYAAGLSTTAYVEPLAVGDFLPEMPLFLEPGLYVNVPLEPTYMSAWQSVPQRWRMELEPAAR